MGYLIGFGQAAEVELDAALRPRLDVRHIGIGNAQQQEDDEGGRSTARSAAQSPRPRGAMRSIMRTAISRIWGSSTATRRG